MSRDAETVNEQVESGIQIDTATLELLAGWRRADATGNPDEIRAAKEDLDEFKSAMNRNRLVTGDPVLYP